MLLLLSTSDTDLLSARAAGGPVDYRFANPSRLDLGELPALLDGIDLVVVRLLGGVRAWQDGLDQLIATGLPVVVLTGEQAPDAQLMASSTVPVGIAAESHAYLAHGGPANLEQLARFLSDTVLLTGHGFEPPAPAPSWGPLERTARVGVEGPTVAVLYYRAHHMSGNTAFVDALCGAIEDAGARALPLYVASLRAPEPELIEELRAADAIVTTVLAAGGTKPAEASAGGDDESWDAGALTGLDVPILQALCLTGSRSAWEENDEGVSPLDAASQIAVPEFDGRLITVPFSFKEIDEDGLPAYVADAERAARVAGIAVRHARLKHIPAADKRLALVLSAYPTKHSRIGNAVGLDTPASAVELLRRLRAEGYDFGPEADIPGLVSGDGDELIRALIDAGGHDQDWLTEEQLAANPVRIPAADYKRWYATLPQELRDSVEQHWGPPPGEMFLDRSRVGQGGDPEGDIVLAALRRENLLILIQPPRGFGENPIAIYHDPDLPPSHHYLAAYRWIAAPAADNGFGADAMIHLGKHGNLEWLPGKNAGLSAACGPDAALGDLPLVYPFLVNDPGEGTQAKRRVHATLIDHLVPPMARADSYGDIARLEQLLDEYAQISSMDPAKLPAIRAQIWTLIQAAKLDHDLGLEQRPDDDGFDDFLLHVDGWLCEIKDMQIRDGLHVLGNPPAGADRVNLVLAVLRARQIWGGTTALPGLREALGLDESAATRVTADEAEATARALVQAMDDADWDPAAVASVAADHGEQVAAILEFAAREVVPRLAATTAELDHAVHALNGGFVPAGPSGSPLRGLVNVLPTGRNFYSVDPKAVPSRLAWETGQALADSLVERYTQDNDGTYPTSVGLSLWGTSAMRTAGDDVAEAMALLGIRPVWDDASRRVTGLEAIPYEELGRPRIDVTLRISGFFRDAFPHTIGLLDDAVRLAASLDEPADRNYVRAHAQADLAEHGDERRATTRIFGSRPGTYGAGLLQLIDSRDWRTDADLAEVYTVWGGYAYGRGLEGRPARAEMETAYKRIAVAAKNTDTREHDIADSDDYFQYHGGMVATVRALRGTAPEAYIGDSTRPETVRTRTLVEETSRVFRARVVNPKWIEAMRRHGYKGAFELAATVDYLFGYDATTGVVADWMYDKLTETYVLDPTNREFLQKANPWALHGIAERLLEAESRGMWAKPDPAVLEALRQAYLETEGNLEDGGDEG
ncbi:cobaltochelatase subunit CobN [Streptomyces sp. Je 1-369]|uniref:cobaltochelatase subunit CobN n=1 Tax=Streptomyces sp. Je 1-369 TaxID=2966192 RepID=UPI002285726E|nr:cobaltochelatase subunit CobN [Streptomyces sp. Je 1-369]WAL98405.1 cobaltochelatase subunit CobN [Streptomyces sp. Je 1-369]